MKIGMFADPHYSSQYCRQVEFNRLNRLSYTKIDQAMTFFRENGCELVICLGDLIDKDSTYELCKENLHKISDLIRSFGLPFICVMGNHDAFELERDEFAAISGFPIAPCDFELDGKHFVFWDACHFKTGEHYHRGDSDWTDTELPDLHALQESLDRSSLPTYVFLHQCLDPNIPENHRVYSSEQVRSLIHASGKVLGVFQGHYHPGLESVWDGIPYIALPAMCEGERNWYKIYDL